MDCIKKQQPERKQQGQQKSLLKPGFLNNREGTSSSSDSQPSNVQVQGHSEAKLSSYETVSIRPHIERMPKEALAMFTNINDAIRGANIEYQRAQVEHLENSKKEILETASAALDRIPQGQPKKALLLGVGNGFDIPLQELAQQFDHLTLVELDSKSTENAIKQLLPKLQEKIRFVEADMTGVTGRYCQEIHELISTTSSAEEFFTLAPTITNNIAEQSTKNIPDVGNDYAFVCSQLVLSQLGSIPDCYVQNAVKQKFGVQLSSPLSSANDRFCNSRRKLEKNLQQGHIRYLAKSVSPLGTVHLADTYKKWLYLPHRQEHNMVFFEIIDPVLNKNFISRKKATQWLFEQTPTIQTFGVVSHSLEPK